MSHGSNCGFHWVELVALGLILGFVVELSSSPAAESQKPTTLNEIAEQMQEAAEKPKSITALDNAALILGIVRKGAREPAANEELTKTLTRFAMLSKGQIRPNDTDELKARFFLLALREWIRSNEEQAVMMEAKMKLQAEYGVTPE